VQRRFISFVARRSHSAGVQNLGEAEYVVAVFQYMRLCGYPADKITILTTYNGQKQLIRDVVKKRCTPFPIFGEPSKIETVDKYQGQQNDYVLLSLVRTKAVGHVRDVRRLVVALSRARLGLYVFCRAKLFSDCYELAPAFAQLSKLPQQLELLLGEQYPSVRPEGTIPEGSPFVAAAVEGVEHIGKLVGQVYSAQMMVAASQQLFVAAAMDPAIGVLPEQKPEELDLAEAGDESDDE
jgi:intron-binding protein aquarius